MVVRSSPKSFMNITNASIHEQSPYQMHQNRSSANYQRNKRSNKTLMNVNRGYVEAFTKFQLNTDSTKQNNELQ